MINVSALEAPEVSSREDVEPGLRSPVPAAVASGTKFYFQFAIDDNGAADGVSLSNAVEAEIP